MTLIVQSQMKATVVNNIRNWSIYPYAWSLLASFPGLHAQLLSYCKWQKLGVEAWERG